MAKEQKQAKDFAPVDPKKATQEQIAAAMELLNKKIERQGKIARGEIKGGKKWSEMTEEEKDKTRAANRRRNVRIKITCQKAEAQGITVSEKEIDDYLAANK